MKSGESPELWLPPGLYLPTADDTMTWCSKRDLAPPYKAATAILGDDISKVRDMFEHKERGIAQKIPSVELYRFGARVIDENGGAVPHRILKTKYKDTFGVLPETAIKHGFENNQRFWLEFDRVTDTSALSNQDLVNIATRHAIRTGVRTIDWGVLERQSADQRLPTNSGIYNHFRHIPIYRELVEKDLGVFDGLSVGLEKEGCSPEAIRAFCNRFEPTEEFSEWLTSSEDVIANLSRDTPNTRYVLGLIANGLNLLDNNVYDMQLEDLMARLWGFGIRHKDKTRFVMEAVPRLDADEAMEIMAQLYYQKDT